MNQNTNTPTEEQSLLNDADRYFYNHKQTFTGINAGSYLDEEDFMKFANSAAQENKLLKEQVEKLKELERSFYMNICRAYNAGKQAMNNQHQDAREKGKEHFEDRFVSSHDYFINEFSNFTTNVP